MVILHDEIKTIQNWVFVLFKKEEKSVSFQKPKQIDLKKHVGWFYLKNGFFSILVIFQPFFVIFPWLHDLEQATSLSVWLGCAPHTQSIGPWW